MTKQSKILVFSLVSGLLVGASGILYFELRFIPALIGGLLSGIYVGVVLFKVNRSSNYPYWKRDKERMVQISQKEVQER